MSWFRDRVPSEPPHASPHVIEDMGQVRPHRLVKAFGIDWIATSTAVAGGDSLVAGGLRYNRGGRPAVRMSMASKVFCTQAAFEVASAGVQLHGGLGLCKEMLIEKLFRDARASMIEDGDHEVLALAAAQRFISE